MLYYYVRTPREGFDITSCIHELVSRICIIRSCLPRAREPRHNQKA